MNHIRNGVVLSLIFSLGTLIVAAQQPEDFSKLDFATLQQRAAAGEAPAQAEIGWRYIWGKGVTRDYAQSAVWCRKGADQGNASAQFCLFEAYLTGIAGSGPQALFWLRKAADQGYPPAELRLAYAYELGNVAPKDLTEARKWFQRAADQGNQSAKRKLDSLDRTAAVLNTPLPDIGPILDASTRKELIFSREELQELKSNGYASKDIKTANRTDPESALKSRLLGEAMANILKIHDERVELAFQRACALPYDETRFVNFCAKLGEFYEGRNPVMALAVYTRAPKCKSDLGGSARLGPPCLKRAAQLYDSVGDTNNARLAYGKICSEYSIPSTCDRFKELGGQVNLAEVAATFESNVQDEKEQRQQDAEDRAEQHRESDARFNAVLGAMQSMPGGSDPNAVINAGNQQAAAIRSIGDANAAAKQAAAQQQLAAQQAAQQHSVSSTSTASVSTASSSASTQASSGGPGNGVNSSGVTPPSGGTGPATASAAGQSCTTMNSSVTVNYEWRTGSGGFCSPRCSRL